MQSALYRSIKDNFIVKKLRKQHRDNFLTETSGVINASEVNDIQKYRQLKNHFLSMLQYMDVVHYNSKLTKEIYEKHITVNRSVIIPVTHSDIADNFTQKYFSDELKITYLGPNSAGKGYPVLKQALDQLWDEGMKFVLNIFFEPGEKAEYLKIRERYCYSQLKNIFEDTDILVAPSVMYESFGYTTAEALSYGVPVLITENVGARDIVPEKGGIVISDISADGIKDAVLKLDKNTLEDMHTAIKAEYKTLKIEDFSSRIKKHCYL